MKTKIALALMFALTFSLSAVYAQKPGYRDNNTYERNRYGINHGKIDKHESRDIARQKRDLQKKIRHAKRNDGHISRAERRRIERDWRAMNRDIYKYKRNDWNRH